MGGTGYVNLLFEGAQDLFLSGQPQITFWKQTWRRHTNHAVESIPVQFTGQVDFGRKFTCLLPKSTDLVHKMMLQITIPNLRPVGTPTIGSKIRWVDKLGHAIIKRATVQINGHDMDSHTGEYLDVHTDLHIPESKKAAYNRMIGHVSILHADATAQQYTMFIPLRFWFCEASGLSLPTMAMQYAQTKVIIELRSLAELTVQSVVTDIYAGSLIDATLYCDCCWLDQDERQRFLDGKHEYLISQVQQVQERVSPSLNTIRLTFSHPVKWFVVMIRKDEYTLSNVNQLFNYTTTLQDRVSTAAAFDDPIDMHDAVATGPVLAMNLLLNAKERWQSRIGSYYNWVQPFQWFDGCPTSPGVYPYSFALRPTDPSQPSGSLNFSRVTTAVLNLNYDPSVFLSSSGIACTATLQVYAVNSNILIVHKGQASVAFSS